MSIAKPFAAGSTPKVLGPCENHVATPADFDFLGSLAAVGEDNDDFNDYCNAIRVVSDAVIDNSELAEAIAVLMNRANAYGLHKA